MQQYQKAVERLEEALNEEKNDLVRDATIKRFEFSFDLAWKLLKARLEEEKGIVCHSPKGCFREAYTAGILDYDNYWLDITDLRNKTARIYDQQLAEEVYAALPKVLEYFKKLLRS